MSVDERWLWAGLVLSWVVIIVQSTIDARLIKLQRQRIKQLEDGAKP